MILRNGSICLGYTLAGIQISVPRYGSEPSTQDLRRLDGQYYDPQSGYSVSSQLKKTTSFLIPDNVDSYSEGVVINFGVGTSAEDRDQYCLAETMIPSPDNPSESIDVNTLLTITSHQLTVDVYGNMHYSYLFNNTSNIDLEFKEVGLMLQRACSGYSGRFLIARTLLETPLVLPATGTATYVYTIEFNSI